MDRFRLAGEAEAEAQQRNQHLQKHVLQLQQQLEDQGCVLADTKKQVLFLLVFVQMFPMQVGATSSRSWKTVRYKKTMVHHFNNWI